jgi:MOSC domain-containing protein YiiM
MMPELTAEVSALFLGSAREIVSTGTTEWWDKPWRTGFWKESMNVPCWLGYGGFRGDEQADRVNHGGVDKAVCVYPSEHYPTWRQTLGLQDLPFGAFGENLTTCGLTETGVCIGDVFTIGEARVQVSQPRQPCWKLARRWQIKDLTAQVERTGLTGFYFRVLHHGHVCVGNRVALVERHHADWSIQRCNEVMHHRKTDFDQARALATLSLLSASWKDSLWARSGATSASVSTTARTHQP